MAREKTPPPLVLDQSADPAARAEALMFHEAGLDPDEDGEDTPPAASNRSKPLPPVKALAGRKTPDGSLIPDLAAIYGEDAEVISTTYKKIVGVTLETRKEVRPTRVRRSILPESIYSPDLNPELVNLIFLFFKDVMSHDEILKFIGLAAGRNVSPVTMLREGLWDLLWNKRRTNLEGAPADRKASDEQEDSIQNQQLIMLLEFDVYDQLQNRAQAHSCSGPTALAWIVRNAFLAQEWDMR
jgi:hypothetical protein